MPNRSTFLLEPTRGLWIALLGSVVLLLQPARLLFDVPGAVSGGLLFILAAVAAAFCWSAAGSSGDADPHWGWRWLGVALLVRCGWLLFSGAGFSVPHEASGLAAVAELPARSVSLGLYLYLILPPRRKKDGPRRLSTDILLGALCWGAFHALLAPTVHGLARGVSWGVAAIVAFDLIPALGGGLALFITPPLSLSPPRVIWLRAGAGANLLHAALISLQREGLTDVRPWIEPAIELLAAAAVATLGIAAAAARESRGKGWSVEPQTAWGFLGVPLLATICVFWVALAEAVQISPAATGARTGLVFVFLIAYSTLMFLRQLESQYHNRAWIRKLQQQRNRLRDMLDNIHDAVVVEDRNGHIEFANRQFHRFFGLQPAQVPVTRMPHLIHPDDRARVADHYRRCLEEKSASSQFEYRALRSDGSTIYLESSLTPVKSDSRVKGLHSVIRDISARRLIEASQRAMAQRLEFFVSQMPLGCIIWDADFSVQEWNESATHIFGYQPSEALYCKYTDLLADEEERKHISRIWKKLAAGKAAVHRECENVTKDGRKIECEWFHTSLVNEARQVVAVASMVQDLTERKSLQRQLIQSQKMEAVGTLAGGIAHDFNNLLTTIIGNLSLALSKIGPSHPTVRGLSEAEKAARRAAELTQQLMRFSRKSSSKLEPIEVNQSIRNVLDLLEPSVGTQVKVEHDLESQAWPVEADPGQLEQVLMNLCVNAKQAIGESGWIRVESSNRRLDERHVRDHPQARSGEFVEIAVSDNGCGIDEETMSHIFEPFFTTKGVGEGTGLGLAMVYGLVSSYDGWVEVASKKGEGSVFRVFLPRSYRAVGSAAALGRAAPRQGSETVLLVDDEPSIRSLGREVLETHGYRVLEAANGTEGVEIFRSNREAVDLVVLDRTMPHKSGKEALLEIRAAAPQVPVILSSGSLPDEEHRDAALPEKIMFLSKPYNAEQLVEAVEETLDATRKAVRPKESLVPSR